MNQLSTTRPTPSLIHYAFPAALMIPLPLIIALVIAPILTQVALLLCVPALAAFAGGCSYISGMAEHDPHKAHFENVLDLIRGYPNDWVTTACAVERGRAQGFVHDLHKNVIVLEDYRYDSDGVRSTKIVVRLYDTTDKKRKTFTDFAPEREYSALFKQAIRDLITYREMKMFVNVALEAEQHKSPVDSAIKALDDFRARKGMEQIG